MVMLIKPVQFARTYSYGSTGNDNANVIFWLVNHYLLSLA